MIRRIDRVTGTTFEIRLSTIRTLDIRFAVPDDRTPKKLLQPNAPLIPLPKMQF
ncbi:MAG: hypothetical protein WBA89_18500 [Microcoleus sp.]|uniref:hypothetical protein n=1 Tax=Microcoleus sp. TaxID=44472 RepID=UPI003C70B8C1